MALTLVRSSTLNSAANNIISINSRSQRSAVKVINDYRLFGRFLDDKTLEIQREELPSIKQIKEFSKINVTNTFGSTGGFLSSILSGGLDIGGFIRGVFKGKGSKIGGPVKVQNPRTAPKPIVKGGKLKLGGVRALGVANAIFAGLDFATGLAQGESIGKSAAGTSGSLAGSLLGGAIGQALIPIPGVGFVVGGAVGGFLGGWTADRVYDSASGIMRSVRQKQDEELARGKTERPDVNRASSIQRQNKVLSKFNSSVSSFESLIKGILEGKITLTGISAPMDDINAQTRVQSQVTQGENVIAEGGELPSNYFTSPYGNNRNHAGVDYAGPRNSPISVIVPGKVVVAEDLPGYGNTVIIEHPDGKESLYGHLSEIRVRVGQDITPGTVIGIQGSTGRSTGDHVHFELRPKGGMGGSSIPINNNEGDRYFRFGGNVRVVSSPSMETPGIFSTPRTDLIPGATVSTPFGMQASMSASNIPATRTDNIKGYIIVPGHITGGGADGEIRAVEKVAINIVNKLKLQFPGIKIILWNNRNYEQTDAGFRKQMNDLKKLEDQGWQVIELHFDAPGGTGRGIILPSNRNQINPIESALAKLGAYPRNWRGGLLGPSKGISLFELGNMTSELNRSIQAGDQRAIDYFSRDFIAVVSAAAAAGQVPGVSAAQFRSSSLINSAATYTAPPSSARNLNINYQLPYNQTSTQIILVDRPIVTMIPSGSNGGPRVVPIPTGGGGGSVNVIVSGSTGVSNVLNKIQEYRLT